MNDNEKVLDSTIKYLTLLAQVRNAVSVAISTGWYYPVESLKDIADYTFYMMDNRYFSTFHTAEDLNYFITKPWKYENEINLCRLYDIVLEMAFGSTLEKFEINSFKWEIWSIFEKFVDKNLYVEQICEFIDEEIADELLDEIDYYTDLIANTN